MPSRFLILLLLLLSPLSGLAAPRVVATIMPVHALAAGVMQGIGEPQLLLPPSASPHSYSLTPSDARLLAQAELVLWIGAGLEQFLQKPLQTLAGRAAKLELAQVKGLKLLSASPGHEHAGTEHAHYDPHLWLDPGNAIALIEAIAEQLSALDPENAAAYRRNAKQRQAQLRSLDAELRQVLQPVQNKPFMVFHDAYRYFEQHYGLFDAGALTLNPERLPGARTVAAARKQVQELGIRCIFREPQFEPSLAETIARGTSARIGVLDPIGADIAPGPDAYTQLLRNLADSLSTCLSG